MIKIEDLQKKIKIEQIRKETMRTIEVFALLKIPLL